MRQWHPLGIIFVGYMLSLATTLTTVITFLMAYSNRNKHILISIDSHGEATIEFILIPIVLGVILMGLIKTYKYLRYDVEEVDL